jgi:DNA-binding NarL/FixJ family response regulator
MGHGSVLSAHPLRVLVVEDAPLMAALLRLDISHNLPAVRVVGVAEGQTAAIAALETEKPDALILDLNLTEGSGLGILRYLRERNAQIPTVVYTNYAEPEIRDASAKLGGNLFLDKSRDHERLMKLLQAWSVEKTYRSPPTSPQSSG